MSPTSVGLGAYGRAANYNARQAARWSKQYELSTAPGTGLRQASMQQLAAALGQRAPAVDSAMRGEGSIVHGDFRLGVKKCDVDGVIGRVYAA